MKTGPDARRLAYTIEEAARLLSLSRSTLYELMAAGELETIKVGRARRVTEDQLQDFIRRHTAAEAGQP